MAIRALSKEGPLEVTESALACSYELSYRRNRVVESQELLLYYLRGIFFWLSEQSHFFSEQLVRIYLVDSLYAKVRVNEVMIGRY